MFWTLRNEPSARDPSRGGYTTEGHSTRMQVEEIPFQGDKTIMIGGPKTILWGEDVIGNVSAYPALPTILCHRCGSKLHRVYNTETEWSYLCLKEKILVDPENQEQMLEIEVD